MLANQLKRQHILIGDDESEVRAYLKTALECLDYSVELAEDGHEVLNQIRSRGSEFSAVLLDLMMPRIDGMEVLREVRCIAPDLPVIIVSGESSTLNIVNAMKCGAADFLSKPIAHERLVEGLRKVLEDKPAFEQTAPVSGPLSKSRVSLGASPRMQAIRLMVGQVGWSETPVLIQGETGTGKEVLARELHAHSPRSNKTFLKLNCAALPSELVESELFGYERGAFTGAFQKKVGMFEAANGGTILLDEIGDMDVRLQAKLLQVLQDKEFQRVGGKDVIKVDVRVMAATHRNLEQAIFEGKFREDLYYRLNVINFELPPLRERKEDILPLAELLLNKHAVSGGTVVLTAELKQAMLSHPWWGNVRELENVMRRLLVLRDAKLIANELRAKAARLPQRAAHTASAAYLPSDAASSWRSLEAEPAPILAQVTRAKEQAETEAILAALATTRWNRKQAAMLLKIDYKALLYKMKKLGLDDQPAAMSAAPETLALSMAASTVA